MLRNPTKFIRFVLHTLPILVLFYGSIWIIVNSKKGFDITDEGFYLLWAARAADVEIGLTQFGHYTGILYHLVGGSIFGFRLVGLIFLLGAAALFAVLLTNTIDGWFGLGDRRSEKIARIATIVIGVFAYYRTWLPTPSYNWLALLGVLTAFSGLLLATAPGGEGQRPLRAVGGILIGAGGVLAFMAKPSTATVLAAISALWLLAFGGGWRGRMYCALCAGGSALAFFGLHVVFFEASLSSYWDELHRGLAFAPLLGLHGLETLTWKTWDELRELPATIYDMTGPGWIGLPLAAVPFIRLSTDVRARLADLLALSAVLFIGCRLWRGGYWNGGLGASDKLGVGGLALVYCVWVIVIIDWLLVRFFPGRAARGATATSVNLARAVALASFMLAASFAFSYGSGIGLVRQSASAFLFFVAAALVLLGFLQTLLPRALTPAVFCAVVAAGMVWLLPGIAKLPYRLVAPLALQTEAIEVGEHKARILVDAATRDYLQALESAAAEAGWAPDTPLIDLTGGSPGAAFALAGRAPVTPWLLGGYKGSDDFVERALCLAPKTMLDSAWILTAPHGRRKLSDSLLGELGIAFPANYQRVGGFKTGHRAEEQSLWRPLAPPPTHPTPPTSACEKLTPREFLH